VAQDPFWRSSAVPASGYPPQGDSFSTQQASGGPASDPFARARYGQGNQGYQASYADQKLPKRSFWRSLGGLSLIIFLLLLVVGVSAFAIYFYPTLCSVGSRNGLRNDIPLPCGITFQDHLNRSASGTTGAGSEEWVYSVDGQTPAQLKSFYQANLPSNGWAIPPAAQNSQVSSGALLACKAPTLAIIAGSQDTNPDDNIAPPPGSSLLIIILVPVKNAPPDLQQALGAGCV
jgi:hypothetical protein